jgi:CheY-like chemotaxis protein
MGSILVIDDEPSNLEVMTAMLARHGYDVLPVESGEDALRACESHPSPIDLVIADVILRGPNAGLLSREIAVLRPGVPILFVSGYPREALAGVLSVADVDAGRAAFLAKPFTTDRLLSEVACLLEKSPGPLPHVPGSLKLA